MKGKCVVSERDRELLAYNGLNSFESLWNLELDWFEEPNYRRNGWSGVSRHVLKRPEGDCCTVFIKRQQNHNFKSWRHPMRGLPTTYREYENICRMKKHGVPCPELVFYAHRNGPGQMQAILITRSMEGYRPLEDCLGSLGSDDVGARRALLASVAETVSGMHRHYLQHSCLYAKHILVRLKNNEPSNLHGTYQCDSVVIDLEKMRTSFPLARLAVHDLDQLYRHWRRQEGDWEAFIGSYLACMDSGFLDKVLEGAVLKKATNQIKRKSRRPVFSEPNLGTEYSCDFGLRISDCGLALRHKSATHNPKLGVPEH